MTISVADLREQFANLDVVQDYPQGHILLQTPTPRDEPAETVFTITHEFLVDYDGTAPQLAATIRRALDPSLFTE